MVNLTELAFILASTNKMSTYRIYTDYSEGKRISTGKDWKDKFLQVYPWVEEFSSYDHWRAFWTKKLAVKIHTEATWPGAQPRVRQLENQKKDAWTYKKDLWFTAPAGTYYVGDLCYALEDNVYDNVFGGEVYAGGLYQKGDSFFLVDNTSAGDGTYTDDTGRKYLVDAGIIGICSYDLIDEKKMRKNENNTIHGGQIITFKNPFHINFSDGKFNFHDFKRNEGFTIRT